MMASIWALLNNKVLMSATGPDAELRLPGLGFSPEPLLVTTAIDPPTSTRHPTTADIATAFRFHHGRPGCDGAGGLNCGCGFGGGGAGGGDTNARGCDE